MNYTNHLSSLIELINAKIGKFLIVSSGGIATVGIATPVTKYEPYLISHKLWHLSYAEWMQVAAFVWVCILIIGAVVKFAKWVKSYFE